MKQQEKPEMILILGDLHIPSRVNEIPEEIKKILLPNKRKINKILCTGNIGNNETLDWLKDLINWDSNNNFHCVKSEFDEDSKKSLPETKVIKVGDFKIGLINGYQTIPLGDVESLSYYQKLLDVDILVSGNTHHHSILYYEGKHFINPGSLTGAFSPLINDPNPSFIILLITNEVCYMYVYELNQTTKNFEIIKKEITKTQV